MIPAKLWQSLPAPPKLRIKSKKCWAHPAVGQIHYGERITTKIQWHCPQLIHTSFHCWLCWYRFYSIFSPKCFRPNHVIGLMVYRKTGFKTDCVASQQCRNLVLLCANISSDWSDRNAHCCFWLFFRCFGISDSSNRMHQHQHIRTHFSTVEDGRFQKVPLLGNALPCLETLKSSRLPNAKFQPRSLRIAALAQFGSNFLPSIYHIIYQISNIIYHISYIYINIHQFSRFSLESYIELSEWSECAWFRRHSETSLPEPSSSATVVTAGSAEPNIFGRSECVLVIELMSFTKRTVSSPL